MDIREYLEVLRKSIAMIVMFSLAGIGIAAGLVIAITPQYTATVTSYIDGDANSTLDQQLGTSSLAQLRLQSLALVIETALVLEPVIENLELDLTVEEVAGAIDVEITPLSFVVEISATDTSPVVARNLANEVNRVFGEIVTGDLAISTGTGVNSDGSALRLVTVNPAGLPSNPSWPRLWIFLAAGAVGGLAIGVAAASLRQSLDNRIHGAKDVAAVTPLPLIGGIYFDDDAPRAPLVVQSNSRSAISESFRTLRTNLDFIGAQNQTRCFVLTSPKPAQGKTTTSANLGIVLAKAGASVVVVDADLRKPDLAGLFGIEGAVGLSDVLIGRVSFDEASQRWGNDGLVILPSGQIPPNPSELLASPEMGSLLRRLTERFDAVIVDAPPILPVTDAAVIGRHAGSSLLVVAAGRTSKNDLAASLDLLASAGSPASAVILNMMPTTGPNSYGAEVYGYGPNTPPEEPSAAPELETREGEPSAPAVANMDELPVSEFYEIDEHPTAISPGRASLLDESIESTAEPFDTETSVRRHEPELMAELESGDVAALSSDFESAALAASEAPIVVEAPSEQEDPSDAAPETVAPSSGAVAVAPIDRTGPRRARAASERSARIAAERLKKSRKSSRTEEELEQLERELEDRNWLENARRDRELFERFEAARREAERLELERVERERNAERLREARLEEQERLNAQRSTAERLDAQELAQFPPPEPGTAVHDRFPIDEDSEDVRLQQEFAARVERDRQERAARAAIERDQAERREAEQREGERLQRDAAAERQRVEAERLELARLEAERAEAERLAEWERVEAQRQEARRLEAERLERERLERERLEWERLENERLERERLERERVERERRVRAAYEEQAAALEQAARERFTRQQEELQEQLQAQIERDRGELEERIRRQLAEHRRAPQELSIAPVTRLPRALGDVDVDETIRRSSAPRPSLLTDIDPEDY